MVDSVTETAWSQAWDAATVEQRRTSRRWQQGVVFRSGLTGNRSQCPDCGDFFASEYAFDTHRIGKYGECGKHRICLTIPKMLEQGFVRNEGYYWTTGRLPPITRSQNQ